jgi:putative DNA primase/helicase
VPLATGERSYAYNLTDLGNAELLIDRYGPNLLYIPERDVFAVWNGRVWTWEGQLVDALANETIRSAYGEIPRIDDQDKRKELFRHLIRSEQNGALVAMVARARSLARRAPLSDFDADPYLLNCLNGVVDLRTGKSLPHNPNYLMTKLAGAEYVQGAQCPLFQKFMYRNMGMSADASEGQLESAERKVLYLQKVLGYAATASVKEKAVWVFHGPQNAGKTVTLEICRMALGSYAGTMLIDTLLSKETDNAAYTDISDLHGRRLVTSSECDRNVKLAVARLKYLSGGGTVKAKRMRQDMFEFLPTHKLILDTNDLPIIRGADEALFARLHCVPFSYPLHESELDKDLKEKLAAELPGILGWIVAGARRWFAEGLERPAEVQTTDAYREDSDPLRDFFEDRCELASDAEIMSADLWSTYLIWARESGEKYSLNRTAFGKALEDKGLRPARDHRGRFLAGNPQGRDA